MTDTADLEQRLREAAQLMQSIANGHGWGRGMPTEQREQYLLACVLMREAADALSSLTRELEEAKKGVARWKSVVRAARSQSGKWGEQARWQLPDPDWRPRTEEELARLRAVDEPEPSGLSTDQAPAVTGQGEK